MECSLFIKKVYAIFEKCIFEKCIFEPSGGAPARRMAVWGADGPLALRAPGEPGSVCYAAPEHGTPGEGGALAFRCEDPHSQLII